MQTTGFGGTLDLGIGVASSWELGVWAEGMSHAAGDACDSHGVGQMTCSVLVFAGGPFVRYIIPVSHSTRPWLALGFGYRWERYASSTTVDSATVNGFSIFHGFEWLHAKVGLDYYVSELFGLGPFAEVNMGSFSATTINYPGNTTSESIDDTSTHQFVLLGARGVFDIALGGAQ
jgi:hypothetical protein